MAPTGTTEQIGDDEIIYRRIPVSRGWFVNGKVSPQAFDPNKDDTDGLSVNRAAFVSAPELAAKGMSKKGYYVAELQAIGLREAGIRVVPDALPADEGHALILDLTYNNRNSDQSLLLKVMLADLCLKIHGPYLPLQ